ncbi:MAG: OsmC family protein [Acidimicrobiia bacterium]|nr:OsmC family protein [Acidimicrobiia bacterium]
MTTINGIDVDDLQSFRRSIQKDSIKADRRPTVVAQWVGGSRLRIECGDVVAYLGGEGELNAMQALLAALAACDIDVMAMHAAMIGVQIEDMTVEATGHFNLASYLGLDHASGPGYDGMTYRICLWAPGASPEQVAYLRERCERSSPVGDSLSRAIPLELDIQVEEYAAETG